MTIIEYKNSRAGDGRTTNVLGPGMCPHCGQQGPHSRSCMEELTRLVMAEAIEVDRLEKEELLLKKRLEEARVRLDSNEAIFNGLQARLEEEQDFVTALIELIARIQEHDNSAGEKLPEDIRTEIQEYLTKANTPLD